MTDTHALDTNRLRLVLRANAATSIAGGAIALIAGSWVSRELGIDHVTLTRLLGAGLIGFALLVLGIAGSNERRLLSESLLVSMGDAAWVVGTIVVVTTGALTTTGNIVAALVALAVADFGVAQLWFRARALRGSEQVHAVAA